MRKKMKFLFWPLAVMLITGVIGIAQMCESDDLSGDSGVLEADGGLTEAIEATYVPSGPAMDLRVVEIETEHDAQLEQLLEQIKNTPDCMQREALQKQVQQAKAEHQIARTMVEKSIAEEMDQADRVMELQDVLDQSHEVNARPATNNEPQPAPDMMPETPGPKRRNADDL